MTLLTLCTDILKETKSTNIPSAIIGNNDDVELRISINNKLDYQDGPIETFEKFGLPLNKNIKILGTLSEDEYVKEIQNADLYISC